MKILVLTTLPPPCTVCLIFCFLFYFHFLPHDILIYPAFGTLLGFVESHIFPIEEDAYDHEYDEVPSDEEPADKESTPEVTVFLFSLHQCRRGRYG